MANSEHKLYGLPGDQESELAAQSSRILASCSGFGETATLRLIDSDKDITVPVRAIHMLSDILNQMAQGNAVSIIPVHAELTTQEAADMLNVSRPYFIKNILDAGKLDYHKNGNRRKILYKDLIKYKERQKERSRQIISELSQMDQDDGLL